MHSVSPIVPVFNATEREDSSDTRKRQKLSEYAHLEQLHLYRTQKAFQQLQQNASMELIGDFGRPEVLDYRNASSAQIAGLSEDNDEEVDVIGSGDDADDGHFVLSSQWQTQRDNVRKKRKRKSFPFSERREPQTEPLGFSSSSSSSFTPTTSKRQLASVGADSAHVDSSASTSPPSTSSSSAHPKMQIAFGSRHSRLHSSRSRKGAMMAMGGSDDSEGDVDLIGEDGEEALTSKDLYASTNVTMTKAEIEDGEDEIADIMDEDDLDEDQEGRDDYEEPSMNAPPKLREPSPSSDRTPFQHQQQRRQQQPTLSPPRVKLVLSNSEEEVRRMRASFKSPAPLPLARRSSRLNAVNVTEYEYDIEAPSSSEADTTSSAASHFKTQSRPSNTTLQSPSSTSSSSHVPELFHSVLSKSLPSTPSNQGTTTSESRNSKKTRNSSSKAPPRSAVASSVPRKLDHGIVSSQDINDFYLSLQPKSYQKKASQPKGMVPVLFSYQLRAVSWMTERESTEWMRDGVRGGILADEMGLGKTIEMMGLIISNPRSRFLRPSASSSSSSSSSSSASPSSAIANATSSSALSSTSPSPPSAPTASQMDTTSNTDIMSASTNDININNTPFPVKLFLKMDGWVGPPFDCHDSSSTLIVCPDILLPQWREEMARHSPSLVVHTYHGMPALTGLERALDSSGANMFSLYDVVLCSYETLAKEFPYATKPNVKTRNQQEQPSTPMTKLRWWRIIMDEAQMFSQGASNAGKLLKNLRSVNKWAVSGTPIRKDFTDLKGLLLFLDSEQHYYRHTPEALSFIRQVSWRHQMEQVSDEIIIPPAETHVLEVEWNALETFGASKLASKLKLSPALFHSSDGKNVMETHTITATTANTTAIPMNSMELPDDSHPEATSDTTPTSYAVNEVLSIKTGKYASCPYQVLLDKCMDQKAILPHADRLLLSRSLSTYISGEFYSSQLAVCQAFNAFGDALLLKAKRLQTLPSLSDSQQASFASLVSQATAMYQKALDLVMYKNGTEIYSKLVLLSTMHFSLSPPSAPFSTVWYHTLVNLVESLRMLGKLQEAALLEQRAESVRGTALQSQLNSVASSRFKFRNTKQEASRMIRNRKNYSRGEWWYHGLKWIGENVPDFCARLRKGVQQQFDSQFQLMRTHTLQLNVATVEDVIDKLDLDLTRMDTARTEAMSLAKTPVPTSGAHISEFYDTLDQTDDVLYAYQQLLVRDIEIDGFSGVVQTKVLNLAERLLLFIEYVLVDRHNLIMKQYRFHPELVSAQDETTLFQLARWLLMAEASFREFELMKIELAHAQTYNKTKRDFAASLYDLEHSALPQCDLEQDEFEEESTSSFSEASSPTSMHIEEEQGEGKEDEPPTVYQKGSIPPHHNSITPIDSDHVSAFASSRNVKTIERGRPSSAIALSAASLPDASSLAPLEQRVQHAIENCVTLKHQLEFVLESGREKLPRMETFGSKISTVARKLIEVLQDTEEMRQNPMLMRNKALVFSKWSEPLIQLSVLLLENGIQYKFGKDAGVEGGRTQTNLAQRLASFRDDPEVKVLLLNSKSQSTGLTLTQANHVFLLEDIESAHELQAIGRAYRIGQTRVTHIWKVNVKPGIQPDFCEHVDLLSDVFSKPPVSE